MPLGALIAKLPAALVREAERRALAQAVARIERYRRGAEIAEGDRPGRYLHLVADGWAASVVPLETGSRHITGLYLVGDLCDLEALGRSPPASLVALTEVEAALLDRASLLASLAALPRLGLAFLNLALDRQAMMTAWMTCLGALPRIQQVAYLFCELHFRLGRVNRVEGNAFDLPLTQAGLGEATGMSPVHANRILRQLRRDGLIRLRDHRLELVDLPRLRRLAGFDEALFPS